MSGADVSPTSDADQRLTEAAAWRVRLTEAGVETSLEFEAWLAADEANLDAWAKVDTPWALLGEHANSPALVARRREALARAERASARLRDQGSMWRRLAAAAFLVVVLGASSVSGIFWINAQPRTYATEFGERRSIVLADGSRISLDSATEVRVRYTEDARRLELRRGQARFDVAHDAGRPFSVRARNRTVIALGTVFNVDLLGSEVLVTLIEGRVAVREDAARGEEGAQRPSREYTLTAGQQLIAPLEIEPTIEPANITRAIAWERGQIDFADEELARVAARVSRYTTQRIVIADPEVRSMRLSGVVNTGDLSDFVDLVTAYLPVEAVRLQNGDTEFHRRET